MTTAGLYPSGVVPGPGRGAPAPEACDDGPVVVGASGRFEGLVVFRGCAQVDGQVEGEILCRGTLRLGERARVIGTVEVDELIVGGVLEGEATARQRILLLSTARVRGVIRSRCIGMEDGCVLDGRCETLGSPTED